MFANRPGPPWDLTDLGRSQAAALARSLADRSVTHIYASPLPRALQTARIVADALAVPCVPDPALREYDVGDFEELPYGDAHA